VKTTFWTLAALAFIAAPANAEFVGTLDLKPTGCEAAGRCELMYDFGYIDPSGLGWQAKAGLMTDGSSIPNRAQLIVGGAWDQQFIRASVIHDWYCDRTVRSRRLTHRMFYDALIESGVPKVKALAMYYGVLVGSHMWISLIEGQPCSGIDNCVRNIGGNLRNVSGSLQIPGAIVKKNDNGDLVAYRTPRFDNPDIARDIVEATTIIAGGSIDNPDDVDALANSRHPTDFFLRHGDAVLFEGPSSKYPDK
jgi:hypothetical protein